MFNIFSTLHHRQLSKHLLGLTNIVAILLLCTGSIALALPNSTLPITSTNAEKDILIVGSEQDYPPFATGLTDETADGFTVDLWKAVAAEAGLKYTIRVQPFHELVQDFKAGKLDVLINLAISDERHTYADFTVPHAVIHGGIFVRKSEDSIDSEAYLNGKSIIVLNTDIGHVYALSKGWGKQLVLVNNTAEGMRLLSTGQHDAMLVSKLAGMQTLESLGLTNIKALKVNAGFSQRFAFAVKDGNDVLLSRINEALGIIKSSGTYDILYEKWFGIYEEKELGWRDILKYVSPFLFMFLCLAQYAIYRRNLERKATQKLLQESEAHLRLSQISGGIGTWEADLVKYTQKWSDNCITLLGLSAIQNPSWDDFIALIHPDDRQLVINGTQSNIEHDTPYDVEFRMITASKEYRWVHSTGQVERDETGKPIVMRGIAQDINARKLAELSLRNSEHTLSDVLENVDSYIYLKDIHGHYLYANAKVCELFGKTMDAVIGQSDEYFFDAETSNILRANDNQVLLEGKTVRTEETNLTIKNGVPTTYLSVKLPLRNDAGEIYALCGISTEITDLKRVQQTLQKSEARLTSLFSNMTNGFALHKVVRNTSGQVIDYRFLDVNPAFEAMMGIPRERWLGQRLKEILPSIEEDFWIEAYAQVVNTGEPSKFEKYSHEFGRWFRVHAYSPAAEHFAVIIEDVTEHKLIEEKLLKSESLSRAIIEASAVPFALNDVQGNITYLNKAFVESFGYNLSDIPTLADWWLLAYPNPEYRKQVVDHWQQNLEEAQRSKLPFQPFEIDIQSKDGTLKSTICSATDLKGDFVGTHLVSLMDITERKMREQALTESEFRWKFAIEGSGDALWDWNIASGSVFFSKNWKEMLGYSEEEVANRLEEWKERIHPDDINSTMASLQSHLDGAMQIYISEHRLLCKDGSYKWVLDRGLVMSRGEDGKALRIIGTHSDITTRKVAESKLLQAQDTLKSHQIELQTQNEDLLQSRLALEESRDRYRDLYEFAPVGYFSISNHGLIDEINWKATAMFGLARKEINKHRFAEFVVEDDKDRWHRMFFRMKDLISGEDLNIDLKLHHSNGSIFDANLTCLRMDDDTDEPMLRISMVDITQLKQAETKLINSEAYLQNIFDSEPECIKVIDAKGNLKQMNPAGLAMIEAKSLEQAMSVPLIDLIGPDYREDFIDLHRRVIAGESVQLQFESIGLKGGRRWVETHAVPIKLNGQKSLLAITRDITERKHAEQRVEKLLAEQTTILENKLVGMVTACNRKIIWANLAFQTMLGYSKDEIEGMPTRQLYLSDADYNSVGSSYANIETEGVFRTQLEFAAKDGRHLWLNLSGTMLNKEAGVSLWMFIDVTSQNQSKLAAAKANDLLATVINKVPVRIFWKDKDLRYLGCNIAFAKDAGKDSVFDIIGKNDFELSWADQAENYQIDDRAVMASAVAKISYEEPQTTPESNTIWLRTSKIPLINNQNEVFGILGMYEDITERKLSENELRIAATAFESQEGMMITDENNVILKINSAFTAITGYSSEDVIGQHPSILSSGKHDAAFYKVMWQSIKDTGAWQGEVWNKRKNGELYPEQLCITAVKDNHGVTTNYVGTLTDVTIKLANAEKIQQLAYYDPLTNLPNRRLLLVRLNQALSSCLRNDIGGALLFLDLDHFKSINDTLGHEVGDLMLQQVAERLTACVREGDTVYRLGGDEYVVMLEYLSSNKVEAATQAKAVGEKILSFLNQPYHLATHEHRGSVSIGITIFNKQYKSQEDIIKHADIAMYQAKKSGRNALRFFDPKMQDVINAHVSLEKDLRAALEKQQLHLHYQVQTNANHQPTGAEALIRWTHPERGLVPPLQFIPLAEETGLILPIGLWVIETACKQLKAWEGDALTRELTISINVSAKQFFHTDFVTQVQSTVQHYAINPKLLKLELTESMLLDNVEHTVITMIALQAIGIRFELDDFGTGYSSLQYLKQLPLEQLKIDQSFVRDIVTDNSDRAIVCAIIAMAQSLNLNVIAEGVETEQQKVLLLEKGCYRYQGYLFGKPMPIEQFESALREGKLH